MPTHREEVMLGQDGLLSTDCCLQHLDTGVQGRRQEGAGRGGWGALRLSVHMLKVASKSSKDFPTESQGNPSKRALSPRSLEDYATHSLSLGLWTQNCEEMCPFVLRHRLEECGSQGPTLTLPSFSFMSSFSPPSSFCSRPNSLPHLYSPFLPLLLSLLLDII